MTAPKEMFKLAIDTMQHAHAPYSKFKVGACLRTANNELFAGANVENSSFSLTLCAEAVALGSLISKGHQQIEEVVIVSSSHRPCPPCGACRQRLLEFTDVTTPVHLCTLDGECQTLTMHQLLPYPFSDKVWETT